MIMTSIPTSAALQDLDDFGIEVPSWAYGNSGTRFKVFATKGVPRNPFEKIADAAQVNAVTGLAPKVSLHIPWDRVEDWDELAMFSKEHGVSIGSINSNLFQDDDYKLGSLTNADPRVRAKAVAHHGECIDVMRATRSRDLKIWLPDGTNYAGQDSLRGRQDRLSDSLAQVYELLDDDMRLLLEYKIFEPYFYTMDLPDWGSSLLQCLALGERAKVILDTGHHAPSTNIEFIVMQLLRQNRLGAFDFNSRFYADDDLIVGSADPFQLFRIMVEIVSQGAHKPESGVNFMLDQCHNIEDKIPGQIRSVMNVQQATAKALLLDWESLHAAQQAGDVLGAHGILMDAYEDDVRGLLADRREAMGLPRDPLKTFADSGYLGKIAEERKGGVQASWGA
jgi:L-rhamnose isomerase/sugar isomerase